MNGEDILVIEGSSNVAGGALFLGSIIAAIIIVMVFAFWGDSLKDKKMDKDVNGKSASANKKRDDRTAERDCAASQEKNKRKKRRKKGSLIFEEGVTEEVEEETGFHISDWE